MTDRTPPRELLPIEPDDDVRCFEGCGEIATVARPVGLNTDVLVCSAHATMPHRPQTD